MEGLLGLEPHLVEKSRLSIERALKWLLDQQNADGGWGGSKHAPSSVEETALSIAALAKSLRCLPGIHHPLSAHAHTALTLAGKWLFEKIETDTYKRVSPIGFYFAKLWYWESMYPLVYTAAALSEWRQYTKDLEHRTHSQQE